MKWKRRISHVEGAGQVVHYSVDTAIPYRIYGRWIQGTGYRYRAEYELDTGWWPVGRYELVRLAKIAVEAHDELRQAAK